MAEARAATAFAAIRPSTGFGIHHSRDFVTVSLTLPTFQSLILWVKRRVYRSQNALYNIFYPVGPIFSFLLTVGMMLQVLASEEGSWWRTNYFFDWSWTLSLYVPFFEVLPINFRIAAIAFALGCMLFMYLATLQRVLLRVLLQYKGFLYASPEKPLPLHVKLWAGCVRLLSGRKPMLYSFRGSLPRLSVPSITSTCRRYLRSVKPILPAEQYEDVCAMVAKFKKSAWKLQLLLWVRSWWVKNYVSRWWEVFVYLRGRSSLLNSNYYVLDSAFGTPTANQVARAASVAVEMMAYRRLLDRELLEPIFVKDTTPVCMAQCRRMFSTTRLPGRECDEISHLEKASKYIVVFYKGFYFSLPMHAENDRKALTKPQVERRLCAIMKKVDSGPDAPIDEAEVAVLTGWERTRWAEAREDFFLSNPTNRESLKTIEEAAFVLVLETEEGGKERWSQWANMIFHGNGANRWFDKSINLVVCRDAVVGLHAEHTWGDALVVAHMFEYCLAKDRVGSYNSSGHTIGFEDDASPLPECTPLRWDMARVAPSLRLARQHMDLIRSDLDLLVSRCPIGKKTIKTCSLSPDAFVQMGMCLAYYRLTGAFALTYEACSMRLYRHGRTETHRPVTSEAVQFVLAMEDATTTTDKRVELLRAACEVHTRRLRDAMAGKGVDRHLFALYVASLWYGEESAFLRGAISQPWMLSTSQQPQSQTKIFNPSKNAFDAQFISPGGGFGPVADAGYGVSYMFAGDDNTFFHVSSKKSSPSSNSSTFTSELMTALTDIASMYPKQRSRSIVG